jgi:hypothetical protein
VTPVDDDDIIFDNLMLELKPDDIRSKWHSNNSAIYDYFYGLFLVGNG